MTSSKKVFITSSVMFAFIDRNHPKHQQASAYLRYFAQENFQVYTTLSSIIRTQKDLREHMSYSIAKDYLKTMFLGNIEILFPDEAATKAALKLILSESGRDFSFDQVIINVMAERLQIPQICSFETSKFYFGITLFNLPF